MPNWFYYDVNGKKRGPINSAQLKSLADSQVINRNINIETEDGRKGKAGQIKGLFPTGESYSVQSPSPNASVSNQKVSSGNPSFPRKWFYYDVNGIRQGPLTDEQVKSLINSGIISRDTFLETINGQRGKAGEVRKFFPSNQNSRLTHTTDKFSRNNEKPAIIALLSGLLFIIVVIPFLFSLGSKSPKDLFEKGRSYLPHNESKGIEMIQKAAENGLPEAQNFLGTAYMTGTSGLVRDEQVAELWLTKSAIQGDAWGTYYLGMLKEPKDKKLAIALYMKSAEMGCKAAESQLEIIRSVDAKLYQIEKSNNEFFRELVEILRKNKETIEAMRKLNSNSDY